MNPCGMIFHYLFLCALDGLTMPGQTTPPMAADIFSGLQIEGNIKEREGRKGKEGNRRKKTMGKD